MNVIYKSRAIGEFAVVCYVYAHWLLNEDNSSKGGFHGTHGTPSRSATAHRFCLHQCSYLKGPYQLMIEYAVNNPTL